MSRMTGRRRPFAIVATLASAALALTTFAYHNIAHPSTTRAALALLERSDPDRTYAEIYADPAFVERLVEGTYLEDYGAVEGNERSFRHYFDPESNSGVAYETYFPGWTLLGAEVTKPASGAYPGAKEWARNGAGSSDLQNWEGALKAYGDTDSSRLEAYWRLGHVLHLLADMAEPDHVFNTVHAGSSLMLPDDLNLVLKAFVGDDAVFEAAWQIVMRLPEAQKRAVVKDFTDSLNPYAKLKLWVDMKIAGYALGPAAGNLDNAVFQNRKYVGFERLMDEAYPVLTPERILRRHDFDFYFDMLADTAREAARTGGFTIPLGLTRQLPGIELENAQARAPFERLGQALLTQAAEYGAGLLQHFHDIVDPPPYVRRVTVRQDGELKYQGEWTAHTRRVSGTHAGGPKYSRPYDYDVVEARTLLKRMETEVAAGKTASVRIEFGPGGEGGTAPERILEGSVKVVVGGVEVPGRLDAAAGIWEGSFTPTVPEGKETWDYAIYIEALDADNHFPNRVTYTWGGGQRLGERYALDAEPQTAPRLREFAAPYSLEEYHPGPDANHTIRVKRAKELPYGWKIKELEWWLVVWNGMLELKEGSRERVERDRDWYIVDGPFYGSRDKVTNEICRMISNPRWDPDVLKSGYYGEYKGSTYIIGRLGGCGARKD